MIIKIDGQDYNISDFEQKVLQSYMNKDALQTDLERRVRWAKAKKIDPYQILREKAQNCLARLCKEFSHLLTDPIPATMAEQAALIFAHPSYKDRDAREAEQRALDAADLAQAEAENLKNEERIRQIVREEIALR